MIFNWNVLFYVSLEEFPIDDPYYGEFIGIPVDDLSLIHICPLIKSAGIAHISIHGSCVISSF